MSALHDYLETHRHLVFDDIKGLVAKQSPSLDKTSVDVCGNFLEHLFTTRLGAQCQRFSREKVGDNLLFTIGEGEQKTLLLAHFDTVWDIDSLGTYVDKDEFHGPGSLDMKAGLVQGIWALKALVEHQRLVNHQILFLCTTDEEIASGHSRSLIEETAKQCDQVLVLEPAVEGTHDLKVGRKGSANFYITLHGKASHAGLNPLGGISAAEEMAHQILRINALQDMSKGTSVNVGIARSGTRPNVIPAKAELTIDVRFTNLEEASRVEDAIRHLTPVLDGVHIDIEGQINRPPMEFTDATKNLLDKAQACAKQLGIELEGKFVGGGSDGNFTQALGIPTLDGLGAVGAGAHANNEHIVISTIPQRAALVAELIAAIGE